jgi:hypothetical protein
MLEDISFVARTLSSGTMAELTRLNWYQEIEDIQYDFARSVKQQISSGALDRKAP